MATVAAAEARATLPDLLTRVEHGEEVTITRHGRPVAVIVRPDRLNRRRAEATLDDASRLARLLQDAASEPLASGPGISKERAEELVASVRAGRSGR